MNIDPVNSKREVLSPGNLPSPLRRVVKLKPTVPSAELSISVAVLDVSPRIYFNKKIRLRRMPRLVWFIGSRSVRRRIMTASGWCGIRSALQTTDDGSGEDWQIWQAAADIQGYNRRFYLPMRCFFRNVWRSSLHILGNLKMTVADANFLKYDL